MNVLITGSSAGLGRSLAYAFTTKHNSIILHGRNEKRLTEILSDLQSNGKIVDLVIGDLSDARTINELYSTALMRDIDILINNAGQYFWGRPEETPTYILEDIIQTNLLAPIKLTLAIYSIFKAKGHGLIININSLAGKTFNDKESAYCASKWGLRGFMGSFKHAARKDGIGILDVYIGAMKTGMVCPRENENLMLDPDDVAKAIVDLCDSYPNLRLNEVEIGRVEA